ncbi:hypothetical protein ERO13_A02G121400v2 [Gossypium hirsutum]|uniref:Uncharacterized protein n=6 Tax=Gossypium TaxID=3633 RepID=A0A1U8NX68_GOSHI|nr:uncharacterized protein LOC107951905 [Gossypium hirsutum]KAB2094062.1 hypothetical protein ES319_A02G132300v1 [Gossypium barbadense]TYH28485.1 hypothetical protein ES288_A02G146500v1 [Gossypium darwinii]TYI40234.1 hypothetical protein ES332_A02G147900v1 [Gossypium tomentosum]TYJ46709.1 hypothetical protein E1A91_A02G137200v1 [Gossypium mustelinum]KAG4211755.1 hypothetical protein ERO13_A02G121400v2 [Gossypium hirsutum]
MATDGEKEMAAANMEKEERKRRNAEKGLNRMSQIRSARPQSQEHHPIPPSSTHAKDARRESLSFDAQNDGIRDRNAFFSDDDQTSQTNQSHNISAGPAGLSEASTSSNLIQGGTHEISSANSVDVGTDKHAMSGRAVGEKDKSKAMQDRKASTNAESVQKACRNQPNLFSSKLVNSCIIASERARSLCALVIAICVLLSHINFPLLGLSIGRSDSNVASKPIYIILLTDLAIVLSRLFLDKKGVVSAEVEEEKPAAASQDNKENWDGAVMLLERGLVAYQTIRALFIDFSIYAVVVICGTSLL